MRVFIAALIPEEIKREIKNYVDEIMPKWQGVKWEKREKFHITLKFLGEVGESRIAEIEDVTKERIETYSPFDLEISRFGGFPNLKKPRVLFIGTSQNESFMKLQEEIEENLARLGFEPEERRFIPHITIGRIKGRADLRGSLPTPEKTPFSVSEIAIMKSELTPKGSIYTPLSTFRLKV